MDADDDNYGNENTDNVDIKIDDSENSSNIYSTNKTDPRIPDHEKLGVSDSIDTMNGTADEKGTNINGPKSPAFKSFKMLHPIKPLPELVNCFNYDIVPNTAAICACPIHCVDFSWGLKWMFLGGNDGYIRKYNFLNLLMENHH